MLEAITALPRDVQTSLLRFLVRIDPLDEIVGDVLISAVLAFGASEGVHSASQKTLNNVAGTASSISPTDVDIDMLRTIADAPSDFHAPLLRLLLVARPIGNMRPDGLVLRAWEDVYSHRTRTMWVDDVNRIARTVALGPDFDDIVLRFLDNQRNDRREAMEREVQARLDARTIAEPTEPNHQEPSE